MNALEKLRAARAGLILSDPFWGSLALRLELKADDKIASAEVDGKAIYYNPQWIESLPIAEVKGVLAHECAHCILEHPWRMGDRNPRDYNIAADLAINPMLMLQTGFSLPHDAAVDPTYAGQHVEAIYHAIHQERPDPDGDGDQGQEQGQDQEQDSEQQGNGDSNTQGQQQPDPNPDPNGNGGVRPAPQDAEQTPDQQQQEWKTHIAQAAQQAKAMGSMPAGLASTVDEILYPPVPPEVLFRDFIERTARNDYSWQRPNARYAVHGLYLPTLRSDELPEVVIAIDTSGSCWDKVDEFARLVSATLEAYDTRITVLYVDSAVAHVDEFSRADLPLRVQKHGGGGTDFRPAFDYIEEHGIQPACMVYLTDMWGTFPKQEPDYPVVWIATSQDDAPFGEVIRI